MRDNFHILRNLFILADFNSDKVQLLNAIHFFSDKMNNLSIKRLCGYDEKIATFESNFKDLMREEPASSLIYLFYLIWMHHLSGMVYYNLLKSNLLHLFPSCIIDALKNDFLRNVVVYNKQLKLLKEICSLPYSKPDRFFVVKGVVLSSLIYPHAGCRFIGDIDIIVSKDDFDTLRIFLRQKGYRSFPKFFVSLEYSFYKNDSIIEVKLFEREPISTHNYLCYLDNFHFNALDVEDHILYILYRKLIFRNPYSFKLINLFEVNKLIGNFKINWTILFKRAKDCGVDVLLFKILSFLEELSNRKYLPVSLRNKFYEGSKLFDRLGINIEDLVLRYKVFPKNLKQLFYFNIVKKSFSLPISLFAGTNRDKCIKNFLNIIVRTPIQVAIDRNKLKDKIMEKIGIFWR